MSETYSEMLDRHKKEIKDFQDSCPHTHTKIHEFVHGYMMHGGGYEDYCEDCHKVIAVYLQRYKVFHEDGHTFSRQEGKEERILSENLEQWYEANRGYQFIG